MPKPLTATIVIPTRRRSDYLHRALTTIVPQARTHEAEIVVVDDDDDHATEIVATRHGARYVRREGEPGLNSARNT
ncbi:MAG TPA: glycosyltransferase, partial [Baekduia sp.]|nr:glycosyltransferase [Baekduia sp.]